MKSWKYALCALSAAMVVAGCGGGGGSGSATANKVGFTSLVSFGDSLSDVGTYKVSTIAAVGGGQFNVNSANTLNWTHLIAGSYGLPAPCAAQTGLKSIIPAIPAAPVLNISTCRNYAQGSSRVTNPFGPGSAAIQQALPTVPEAAPLGLLALPVANQMANHLTSAGGSYSGKELVTVLAGGNDVFLNLNGVGSAFAGGPGAAGAAQFAGWSPSVQGTVFAGGQPAVTAASQAAVAGMAQAATELVALINTQVLAKGAKYVAVINLPDVSQTPYGSSFDAATRGLINTMVRTFNDTLDAGLKGKAGVIIIDAYSQGRDQTANPGQYALSDVKTPACSTTSAANPLQGNSLTCTASSLIPGDTSKYLYADSVHLTPFGYKLLAEFVTKNLAVAGWL